MNSQDDRSLTKSPWKFLAVILILLCLVVVSGSLPQRADAHVHTFVVNSLGDGGDPFPGDGTCQTTTPGECTLRAALDEANGLYQGYYGPPDTDLHTITVPAGTYFVYSELGVGGNVVINGSGRDVTLITGQGSAVMSVGVGATAIINDLTITNGLAASAAGIYNQGDLTLTNVAVTNNYANVASGGGIRNFGALVLDHVLMSGNTAELNAGAIENVSSATLTITDSTFYRNKSLDTTGTASGGAIWNNTGCSVTVQRSTFDGNSAPFGGGIFNTGDALFTNVTLNNNKGTSTLGAGGAAIYNNTPGQLWLWNVTIAANESTNPAALTNSSNIVVMAHTIVADNIGGDCNNTGSITIGEHHNLAGDSSCTFMTDPSDQTSTDPKLLPLADNGGPTETVALAADSPAIDAGDDIIGCRSGGAPLLTDQRGWPRTVDGDVDGVAICDLGAFEAPPPYQLWLPLIMR
jgi:CSLREA domain-containing protein